jgi:energy-coupling factor transporter ATP-binding protein EcfA2
VTGAALRLAGFSFAYPGTETAALRDVSLDIRPGEIVGIVGAEGSGRTSLGMALCGFVPRFTGGDTVGTIEVDGRDPRGTPVEGLAGGTAMVFEDPESQLTQLHVLDEVLAPLRNRGVEPAEAEWRADRLLERVGLDPLLGRHRTWQLSTGDKARLALAAALATQPRALVLDTVAGRLDPAGRRRLAALVLAMAPGITVVVVDDDLELVASLAHRVVVLVDGAVAAAGPPGEVLASPGLAERAGVGLPVSLRLAARLGLHDHPVTVDGFRLSLARADYQGVSRPGPTAAPAEPLTGPARLPRRRTAAPAGAGVAGQASLTDLQRLVGFLRTDDVRPAPAPGWGPEPVPAPRATTTGATPSPEPPRSAGAVARLVEVSFAHPDGTRALDRVSLDLHGGRVHGLVGGNGAGKSTLARMLAGLVHPQAGRVEVAGADIAGRKARDLLGTVGIVLAHPDHQITERTVAAEVGFPLRGRRSPGPAPRWDATRRAGRRRQRREDVAARVRATCQRVGLGDLLDEDPRLLRRAQRRFVTVATALVLDPPVVVLDEPGVGLDALGRARLRAFLRALRAEGKAVLLAENDIDLVAEVADDLTLLQQGQVTLQGRIEDVLDEPNWSTLTQAHTRPPRAAELGRMIGVRAVKVDQLVTAGDG